MSGYFRRPKDSALNSSMYPSTAETLQHYQDLNSDIEEFVANPVVKLRLSGRKKPRIDSAKPFRRRQAHYSNAEPSERKIKKDRGSSKKKMQTAKSMRDGKLQEIELIDGMGIFHDDEEDLKHEMIDTAKAK